jgi:hypothetical protein
MSVTPAASHTRVPAGRLGRASLILKNVASAGGRSNRGLTERDKHHRGERKPVWPAAGQLDASSAGDSKHAPGNISGLHRKRQ